EQDHAFLVPDVEVTDPELLIDEADQLLDLVTTPIGHLEVESTGDMEAFEVFHPVERHVIVAPAALYRDRDFVGVLTLECPIIDRGDMFDEIHRVGGAIGLEFNQRHERFRAFWALRVEGGCAAKDLGGNTLCAAVAAYGSSS